MSIAVIMNIVMIDLMVTLMLFVVVYSFASECWRGRSYSSSWLGRMARMKIASGMVLIGLEIRVGWWIA
jgi:hypothetical protein